MKKKWEQVESVNLRNDAFSEKEFEQIVEEVANVIYSELCQLQKNSSLDSLTLKDKILKRTGTDA